MQRFVDALRAKMSGAVCWLRALSLRLVRRAFGAPAVHFLSVPIDTPLPTVVLRRSGSTQPVEAGGAPTLANAQGSATRKAASRDTAVYGEAAMGADCGRQAFATGDDIADGARSDGSSADQSMPHSAVLKDCAAVTSPTPKTEYQGEFDEQPADPSAMKPARDPSEFGARRATHGSEHDQPVHEVATVGDAESATAAAGLSAAHGRETQEPTDSSFLDPALNAEEGPQTSTRVDAPFDEFDSLSVDDKNSCSATGKVGTDERADDAKPTAISAGRTSNSAEHRRSHIDIEAMSGPAVVSAPPLADVEYLLWNRALAEHCLFRDGGGDFVYLTITPNVLAAALCELRPGRLLPEDAESAFTKSVAAVYRDLVLSHREKLRVLRRCGVNGLPDCIAFLAASVLAAYQMRTDEEAAATAYYTRLTGLLGCEISGSHPRGFEPEEFEALWRFLEAWLREKGGRLALPGIDGDSRRFVALPLTHVPLRRVDIEHLPEFFVWAGYRPGSSAPGHQLLADMRLWQRTRNALTLTGAEALSDDRSEAVLAQVSAELESWDGCVSDSARRRSALVEIQFDVIQREPILNYLPRRPSGFPPVFDDGEHVLVASEEGWYDPARLQPTDGESLAAGFEWRSMVDDAQFMLRRSGTAVVSLTPSSNCSGLLSSRHLLRGIKCAVLCRDDLVAGVEEYLSEVAQQSMKAVTHPLLPTGWSIVREVIGKKRVEAPAGLEHLEIDPSINVLVSGGLKIGRRLSWLAEAPPRVFVSGVEDDETVKVNGAPVEVSAEGELKINGVLEQPGDYLIEAGRARRRIEIIAPEVAVRGPNGLSNTDSNRIVTIALPQGSWTLIGRSPGDVCRSDGMFLRGTLASCPFRPIWAVQVRARRGTEVAILASPEPPTRFDLRQVKRSSRSEYRRWAASIYDANVSRPSFFAANGASVDERTALLWKQYAAVARRIKRVLKRA